MKANGTNIYDKYQKLLESLIFHKCLVDLPEVPLFLRIPSESTKNFKAIMADWEESTRFNGFMNFNIIL